MRGILNSVSVTMSTCSLAALLEETLSLTELSDSPVLSFSTVSCWSRNNSHSITTGGLFRIVYMRSHSLSRTVPLLISPSFNWTIFSVWLHIEYQATASGHPATWLRTSSSASVRCGGGGGDHHLCLLPHVHLLSRCEWGTITRLFL